MIKQIKKAIAPITTIGIVSSLVGITIQFSKPDYREFVPVVSPTEGYYLNIEDGKTIVQYRGGFSFGYLVDVNGDLKPDYDEMGIAANLRLAGKMRRKPTLERIELFDKVIKNSKRFGGKSS